MDRPLRICFVAYRGNMRCGGQGVYLWFLARELARAGHEVDVLVGPPYPDPMPFVQSLSLLPNQQCWAAWFSRDRRALIPDPPLRALSPLPFYELAASRLGFLPEPFAFSVRALRAIAGRLRRGVRYDVVHDVQSLGWGLLVLRALGLPLVTTLHHPLTIDRRTSFLRDASLREAIGTMTFYPVGMQAAVARRMQRVFTSSHASARWIERDFGVSRARLSVVANGVDTQMFRPDPTVPRDPSAVLCVGRASDPNKGVLTLVEAIARLPEPAHLVLVDDASPHSAALRRARELGIAARVRITGRVETDELVSLYRRAAVVAVPSLFEGFGLPAAEGMACGTPVVASAAGALPEVVKAGGGGVLVPPGDAVALADALQRLLAAPDARAELGRAGRAGVVAAYGWPHIAERTAAVYAEVVAERRGRPVRSTTSAQAGRRRASAPAPLSTRSAQASGSRDTSRDQPGSPQPSEIPST